MKASLILFDGMNNGLKLSGWETTKIPPPPISYPINDLINRDQKMTLYTEITPNGNSTYPSYVEADMGAKVSLQQE